MIHKELANTTRQMLPFMLRFEERDLAYSTVAGVCVEACRRI